MICFIKEAQRHPPFERQAKRMTKLGSAKEHKPLGMWMLAVGTGPEDYDFGIQRETASGEITTINLLGDPVERLRVAPEQLILGRKMLVDEHNRIVGSVGKLHRPSLLERLKKHWSPRKLEAD